MVAGADAGRGPSAMRPLHAGARDARLAPGGNAGLWYDKFCDCWLPNFEGLAAPTTDDPAGGKLRWIREMTGRPVGERRLLQEHHERVRGLAGARGSGVYAVTAGRFVSGLGRSHPVENGFAWHHALGTPYLPGSSIKGAVRTWAAIWAEANGSDIERIFGPRGDRPTPSSGSVVFLDALPVEPVTLEADVMTPHYGPWYQSGETPGDWYSPVPIPFLAVAPGQTFRAALLPRRPGEAADRHDCAQAVGWLREALDVIGAGAKTNVGYGRFRTADGPDEARRIAGEIRDAFTPKQGQAGAGGPAGPQAGAGRRATVDGEPVEVLSVQDGTARVRFLDSGDIEDVPAADLDEG